MRLRSLFSMPSKMLGHDSHFMYPVPIGDETASSRAHILRYFCRLVGANGRPAFHPQGRVKFHGSHTTVIIYADDPTDCMKRKEGSTFDGYGQCCEFDQGLCRRASEVPCSRHPRISISFRLPGQNMVDGLRFRTILQHTQKKSSQDAGFAM